MTASVHTTGRATYPVTGFDVQGALPSKAAIATAAKALKNVALFVAAPFIGLVYAMALPFVGLAMLTWIGAKALVKAPAAHRALIVAKSVALFAAAPFIGLVYAVLLPFVGIAMIARAAWQAYRA